MTTDNNYHSNHRHERNKATFKMVKDNNYSVGRIMQLFYNLTFYNDDASKFTPTYFRELYPLDKNHDRYWYVSALNSPSPSPSDPIIEWSIDSEKLQFTKFFGKPKRSKTFGIKYVKTGSHASFKVRSPQKNESLRCPGQVTNIFDPTCIQRYTWIRALDGKKWTLIATNNIETPLVEFRKTDIKNEFIIAFLMNSPPGWSRVTYDGFGVGNDITGSRFVINNDSSFKDADMYWQEFVLASTVAIQDEVLSKKKRMWKK